ncbi:MAG TPA: HAMP domain-containing sensor histidine kinase [Puia sp.]|jgi:signal transduction histidine kinase|nr:HAMP domain-containing sensor histidine kinase [Puia sp.]
MKLFTKYSRVNIIASILALLLGSIGYYFVIRSVLLHQLDDTLKIEEAEILSFVKTHDRLPEPANYRDQKIEFLPAQSPVPRKFINTTRLDEHHQEDRLYRELLFSVMAEGRLYTVSVSMSEEETEDLLEWIMLITAAMILLLLGCLFLANRLLLRRIWQPFYGTLEAMRQFNLSSRKPLPARDSGIEEFRNLDTAVEQMTGKILKDYEMLKNFTDNASHEMQTPLAIINSKLDLMIQDQGLGEGHLRQLQAMYDAVGRLSKLNQSLLLLTKIENNQFEHTDPVALASLIEEKLVLFEDLIKARGLTVDTRLDNGNLRMNTYLADILLNNLLINAIRHNQHEGEITIRLSENDLSISNTGLALPFDPATIFDRFTKGSHSDGTGLGLAIVKQICDNYGFPLSYARQGDWHTFRIGLPLRHLSPASIA